MNFSNLLDDLVTSLPDIYDGFICNANQKNIASRLSLVQDGQDCMDICRKVEKLMAMATVHYQDIQKFSFCYGNTVLLAYPMSEGTWLFLTHSRELASGLVQAIVDATLPSLKGAKEHTAQSHSIPVPEETSVKESAAAGPQVETVDLVALTGPDGELHKPLGRIEKALIKVVGPIGTVMLEDAMLSWVKECSPGLDNLEQLYPFLEQELDDESQYRKFTMQLDSA